MIRALSRLRAFEGVCVEENVARRYRGRSCLRPAIQAVTDERQLWRDS